MGILKIHDTNEAAGASIKGISKRNLQCSDIVINNDALADGDSNSVNKPGTSIPSLFARMLFFRTAFKGVTNINIHGNEAVPVYNRIVSLCLDVFELVYSHNPNLRFERWNKNEQIANVKKNNSFLAETLQKQVIQHLNVGSQDVRDIYLIYYNNQLIGGTSPYTFVYASSDWKGLGTVRSLCQRQDKKFREFIYKLNIALKSANIKTTQAFSNYVERCLNNAEDGNIRMAMQQLENTGAYGMQAFLEEYPAFEYDNEQRVRIRIYVSSNPELVLPSRPEKGFDSDLFLDSDFADKNAPIDKDNTPLFLHSGAEHDHLYYYDDVRWDSSIEVTGIPEKNNETISKTILPDCTSYRHTWLADFDILEPELMEVPYSINTENFVAINAPSNFGDRTFTSYLLPIRPLFFKYFTTDYLRKNMSFRFVDDVCYLELKIPVTNADRTNRNTIVVRKAYNLNEDVNRWDEEGKSFNFGIFPFYRIPQSITDKIKVSDRYVVMLNVNQDFEPNSDSEYKDTDIVFYKEGAAYPIELNQEKTTIGEAIKSHFFHIDQSFDYIQVKWSAEHSGEDSCGTIIPNFTQVKDGNHDIHYSIDFGTTNSHIAYADSSLAEAKSFSSSDLQNNVVYLNNAHPKVFANSCGLENREFINTEARYFLPHFNDDSYNFPIRTATYENGENGILNMNSKLFSGAAIGLHFSKEFMLDDKYQTNIKWQLENLKLSDASKMRVKLFFEEMMWMIKNHWLTSNSNKSQLPKIVITYPQAMSQKGTIKEFWNQAFIEVFGEHDYSVDDMVESLAPCYKQITVDGNTSKGIMNIDIGGGTTDFQYYQKFSAGAINSIISKYTSVLFAGDDLWGVGYENVKRINQNENNFTRSARTELCDVNINVVSKNNPAANKRVDQIPRSFAPKEFINLLLRDVYGNFRQWLSRNDTNVCRKTLFMHYSAIIYYMGMWIRDDRHINMIPQKIVFTGMGSKYIEMLFDSNDKINKFTDTLLRRVVGSQKTCPGEISVIFEKNPKAATAEGAALFSATNMKPARNTVAYHMGYKGGARRLNVGDISDVTDKVMESFKEFLDIYNSLPGEIDSTYIPKFNSQELEDFINKAEQSLEQMVIEKNEQFREKLETPVSDSLFFWPLKGSLYQLI